MTTTCPAEEAMRTLLLALRDPNLLDHPKGPRSDAPGPGSAPGELLLRLGADGCCHDYIPAPGFTRDVGRIVGMRIDDLVDPHDAAEYLKLINRVIVNQRPNLCYTCLQEGADCRYFEVRTVPAGSDRVLQVVRDITDIREAHARVHEADRQLATLLRNLPGLAYRCANNATWMMEFVSEGCRELTGYEPADLIGSSRISYGELILPEDRAMVQAGVQKSVDRKEPFQLEYRIRRADGAVRWVWERGAGVFTADGILLALEGFITDVTSRKLAEQDAGQRVQQQAVVADLSRMALSGVSDAALFRAAAERVGEALNVPVCGILAFDASAGALRFECGIGYPAEMKKGAAFACPPESQADRALHEVATLCVADYARESRFAAPSWIGPLRPASSVTVRIAGEDAPFGVLEAYSLKPEHFGEREVRFLQVVANLIAHVLQRSWAEKRRLEMARQLRQAQKAEALGTLAAGVAHDFSNFATAVLGYLDLAEMRLGEGGDVRECLEGIRKATDQARNITRSLLTFSRKLDVERAPFPLVEAIREATQLLRHLLPAAVHLVVEVPEGYDPWLIGHSGQLLQVLMNLATNARDAMPQGGKLRIALCPDDEAESPRRGKPSRGFAKLIVEDNGCGIPRESLSRVFDPFFTTKPRERGTGLGLSIVQGIVTDHNGSIAVESTPGVGTRFTLRFPTCPPDPNRATTARPQPCAKGDGETVLIVEDNDLVRALLATAIREAGFCPLQAGDGEEALRLFHTEAARLHLVVLDCDLPKRSGPEVLEEIRRTRPDLPAIMISGDASAPRAALGFSKTLFLSKPFSMAKLTAAMMETLQSAKAAKST